MSATTWAKFYWSDWESDEKLKLCSPGAQALWMRMLCVCAKSDGYLAVEGQKLGPAEMQTMTGWPLKDVRAWWGELQRWGVFSVEGRGKVYSRRMVKEAIRYRNGKETGPKGGNPSLRKDRENSDTLNGHPKGPSGRARNQKPESPKPPAGASISLPDWEGSPDILQALCDSMGRDQALTWLRHCRERHLPSRALVTANHLAFDRISQNAERALRDLGVRIVMEAAA